MTTKDHLFIQRLDSLLKGPLPGGSAQMQLEPATRKLFPDRPSAADPPRESAVLVLLYPQANSLHTVLIKRNDYNGVHSGQVSFPGGKMEASDPDHICTALRETREEIGVAETQIQILGNLSPLYVPPSNFNIQPVVGFSRHALQFSPDPYEVAEIFTVSMEEMLNPALVKKETVRLADGRLFQVPCYVFHQQIVWGATSMIISEFIEIVKQALA
ncbi:MAG: CoA pyrophosphatase [Bacteroidales bacterium]|jgi:8-oxo-dGTP pyrophosphatase MutT (NUDIX family)|nr:CoA pyrophosphatase [Bacteroidales bacterium]MDD3700300.1 CoA pyrophosphatase [Bacteroidales bacterium]MDY0368530.1 CoA pyrophosphatase [Bacteroidales bacterium]